MGGGGSRLALQEQCRSRCAHSWRRPTSTVHVTAQAGAGAESSWSFGHLTLGGEGSSLAESSRALLC